MKFSISFLIYAALLAKVHALPPTPPSEEEDSSCIDEPEPSAVASSSSAIPSASASCTVSTAPQRRASSKFRALSGRAVAQTQYHATCKDDADKIQTAIEGGTVGMLALRTWPDEFTWSGGFYLTPDSTSAQVFAGVFRYDDCQLKNGIVLMEFTLDIEGASTTPADPLNVTPVGEKTDASQAFWNQQFQLGWQIRKTILGSQQDEGEKMAQPTQPQLDATQQRVGSTVWSAYTALSESDIVTGAVPLQPGDTPNDGQKAAMDYVTTRFEMPPLSDPFVQVVLITDKAMKRLKIESVTPLDPCILTKAKAIHGDTEGEELTTDAEHDEPFIPPSSRKRRTRAGVMKFSSRIMPPTEL